MAGSSSGWSSRRAHWRSRVSRPPSRGSWSREAVRVALTVPRQSARLRPRNVSGQVAEWLKAHAWRACIRQKRIAGSNPALSALIQHPGITPDTGAIAGVLLLVLEPNPGRRRLHGGRVARNVPCRGAAGLTATRGGRVTSRPWWAPALQWGIWAAVMTVVMGWLARTRTDAPAPHEARSLAHPRSTLIVGLVCGGFFLALAVVSAMFP